MNDQPKCRWDSETGEYRTEDGETCDTPKRDHCGAKRGCSNHLAWGELTCARCVGDVRRSLRRIVDLAALMPYEAETTGVNSEAAMMAAGATDPRGWAEYRLAAILHLDHWLRMGRIKERQYDYARTTIDDDEFHPYNVLTRWHLMLAEDYGLTLPGRMTLTGAARFLDDILTKIAQDEEQDFPLFRKEISRCRNHLEAVLSTRDFSERGAPCPICSGLGKFARLVRTYPHWCEAEDCHRIHVADDSEDRWQCPRDKAHSWDIESYSRWVEERMGA